MENSFNLECVFKSVTKRDGGDFTNDKGQSIQFDASYVIKLDENRNGDISERKLKFPITNKSLYSKLKELEPYTKIVLACEVQLYNGSARIVPYDIEE